MTSTCINLKFLKEIKIYFYTEEVVLIKKECHFRKKYLGADY
jgi:hypothetical protein